MYMYGCMYIDVYCTERYNNITKHAQSTNITMLVRIITTDVTVCITILFAIYFIPALVLICISL